MGMLTGAVAERMGLLGLVVLAYMGTQSPALDTFKKFQLGRKHNVVRIPLLELKELVVSQSDARNIKNILLLLYPLVLTQFRTRGAMDFADVWDGFLTGVDLLFTG